MTLKEIEDAMRSYCAAGEHVHAVSAIMLCDALKAERERIMGRAEAEPRWAQAVAVADKYRALRAEVLKVAEEIAYPPYADARALREEWAARLRKACE